MGKIALELVRDDHGGIIAVKSFNPYSLKESTDDNKYVQVFNGVPVQELHKMNVVVAEVYYE